MTESPSIEQLDKRVENLELALYAEMQKTEAPEQRLAKLEAGWPEALLPKLVTALTPVLVPEIIKAARALMPEMVALAAKPTYLIMAVFEALLVLGRLEHADVLEALKRIHAREVAKKAPMAKVVEDLMEELLNDWRREHPPDDQERG
jgi:NAD-specific glutamate dehydrogenase